MKEYCVIRSTKNRDYQETVIEANSMDDAREKVRKHYVNKLLEKESFIVFPVANHLGFNELNRLIFPDGDVVILIGQF
ncbi:hypothetical protein [Lentibacillus cibarius]|uniref:Uncharacterized protein n=1 Tax=Lentibacillus cibarius TaxID=2583219 RepID=A0A5S3QIT4_9BACI|nr:hypothetical protein [Lentibacillus cibarius]TMN21840.1 hypothetical protein FFL34_06725 [Lentibacillus cibarius]